MSLALVVLEKLFTRMRTRTPAPQSDDIMSADIKVKGYIEKVKICNFSEKRCVLFRKVKICSFSEKDTSLLEK